MDLFRVRLNCIDHYQSTPTGLDPPLFGSHGSTQQRNAPQLPVIRVFGATETGQRVCAHIHGALPYLYLEYHESLKEDDVETYKQQLRASIDHALAVSYRRNIYDGKAVFVGRITLVKGIPFFGYHVGYRHFLKVYMLNPLHMTRFADLLYQGAILKRVFQPFEAHLQYLLQWMCDFNLYGCAYINCHNLRFRHPVPDFLELRSSKHKWHSRSINPDRILNDDQFPRQSHCSLEVDICVQDILNRKDVEMRDLHADFVERFSVLNTEEKLVHSLTGLWKDETKRRKRRMGLSDTSSSPFPPEVLISMSADPRNTEKGGWIHEEAYRELIKDLVEDECDKNDHGSINFENFVNVHSQESNVKTVLESVEDMFPENLGPESFPNSGNDIGEDNLGAFATVIVDEESIEKLENYEGPCDYEERSTHDQGLPRSDEKMDDVALLSKMQNAPPDMLEELQAESEEHKTLDKSRVSVEGDQDPITFAEPQSRDANRLFEQEPSFGDAVASAIRGKPQQSQRTSSLQPHTRSSKRRKLMDDGSNNALAGQNFVLDEDRPRSRHVKFQNEDGVLESRNCDLNESSADRAHHSTPSSSQLSQTSIKIQGDSSSPHMAFPVVKDPYRARSGQSMSTKESKSTSPETSKSSQRLSKLATPTTSTSLSRSKTSSNAISPLDTPEVRAKKSKQAISVANELSHTFYDGIDRNFFCYRTAPPSVQEVEGSFATLSLPSMNHQDAYYSNERDVPERTRDYAGREFRLESNTFAYLPRFDPSAVLSGINQLVKDPSEPKARKVRQRYEDIRQRCKSRKWEIAAPPPSRIEVETWLVEEQKSKIDHGAEKSNAFYNNRSRATDLRSHLSQIEGPTQKNSHGFKYSQKKDTTSVRHETQYMSTMSLEVHVNSRGSLAPNPEEDEIACVFWCLQDDDDDAEHIHMYGKRVGILALAQNDSIGQQINQELSVEVEYEPTELDLINRLIDIVHEFDPDILTGYEVHNGSWGYVIERARIKFEENLCDELSRMKSQSHGRFGKDADRWGFNHTSTVRVTGRHMINIWRAMQNELNLLQYTMENVVFHVLHKRIPHYTYRDLTQWYKSGNPSDLAKTLNYFLSRTQMNVDILTANELIPRTSEQARLIGVDFFSVFSRGSQFKVESFMFRIAKPENFILVSPSRKQVGQQNALECLPLVMEPQSAFYTSPLLVLDFQSLYPSIMIAYNYCYSTCLGRIVGWRGQNKMGFADFKRQPRLLELVKDSINVAPNGMMFVKQEMRKSLLAKMLSEILESRVMVKSGMKVDKDDRTLQQLLNNRQLALKLLANVTYGYTSASFSGRMPCSEIADSIVQTARETLEKAIAFIHSVDRWGAEVVYGDTDSLFVYLKGRTRAEAFDIGNDIAKEITKLNPRPVKLKFEKVYHPCVLLAKKRYVGFKYESKNQTEPEFDAKGIETVRRDGTPAEQKIEEKALKILFKTADLSQVKSFFLRQCTKIMLGKVSIQDFCFAREVKLGTYADKGPPPPGALISTRRMLEDPRTEPQYGERVPYVVVTGAPGARLIDRCIAPEQLLREEGATDLDAEYYISKNLIPPLERIFNLMGANVRQWYDEMPKVQRIRDITGGGVAFTNGQQNGLPQYMPNGALAGPPKKTLESYMKSSHCVVCRQKLPPPPKIRPGSRSGTASRPSTPVEQSPLCRQCASQPEQSMFTLMLSYKQAGQKLAGLEKICRSCAGLTWSEEVKCDSKDCNVFYSRVRARAGESGARRVVDGVNKLLADTGDIAW